MATIKVTSEFLSSEVESLQLLLVKTGDEEGLPDRWSEKITLTPMAYKKGMSKLLGTDSCPLLVIGLGDKPSLEDLRRAIDRGLQQAQNLGFRKLQIAYLGRSEEWFAIAEAVVLSLYRFTKYLSKPAEQVLSEIQLWGATEFEEEIRLGQARGKATCLARDLVNEPLNSLGAKELAEAMLKFGTEEGCSVKVLGLQEIEALGMGGLLAVNRGSFDPPTFTIMEFVPVGMEGTPPVVLVGKGVVYDTGGLSLKPTPNSMDKMKADMGGAAAVIGAMCGLAQQGVKHRVIGLVPATDNRPGHRAFVPGDVITMYDGSTVEVLNTDAEGRMLLADALSYAKQYEPRLVIDLATLTGAQVVAIGSVGLAMMSKNAEDYLKAFEEAGKAVHERVVSLPLWDEYGQMLRSDIADLKNIGGREAGCITAGKFLEHFTDYPWIHLDIAGPAWLSARDTYRSKGGTGTGVRLILEFLAELPLETV